MPSVSHARPLPMHEILRYAQGANRVEIEVDGYLNYHFVTTPAEVSVSRVKNLAQDSLAESLAFWILDLGLSAGLR